MTNYILSPVGRMVFGCLYEPKTTDMAGKPLTVSKGPNAGKSRVDYFFALAIKKSEADWKQTAWGKEITNAGMLVNPQHAQKPTFHWKVADGDTPNAENKVNENSVGHWILKFSSGFAPNICDINRNIIADKNIVNPGDYIQVYFTVRTNGSSLHPGIYLNFSIVCLVGHGPRIVMQSIDPKKVDFVKEVPPGISSISVSTLTPQTPVSPPSYPQILQPAKRMTAQANGVAYEEYIKAGWNDQQLVQHGYMEA